MDHYFETVKDQSRIKYCIYCKTTYDYIKTRCRCPLYDKCMICGEKCEKNNCYVLCQEHKKKYYEYCNSCSTCTPRIKLSSQSENSSADGKCLYCYGREHKKSPEV